MNSRGPELRCTRRRGRRLRLVPLLWLTTVLSFCGCDSSERLSDLSPETGCQPVLPNQDWQADPYVTVVEEFEMVSSAGDRIYGMLRRPDPDQYPHLCFAAVILVPGGINPGRLFALGEEAGLLAQAGMIVVTFNAEGRADDSGADRASEGSEDYGGHRNQDTLAELVNRIAALEGVSAGNLGIQSQSFGITMATGALARYPDLPIGYLVDGEGPPASYVSAHEPWALDEDPTNDRHEIALRELGHYSTQRDSAAENLAFWEEREAIDFIGAIRVRYLRLQAEWDHAQPPHDVTQIATFTQPPLWWQNKHTMDMVAAAIDGGVPWVRVNLAQHGNAVGRLYDQDHPPRYLPGELADEPWAVRAILEMARMDPLTTSRRSGAQR